MINQTLGQYQIIDELGRGGMGTVYIASQPSLNRRVAIKVLSGQFAHDQEMVARFRRESRAMAKLTHPNIVQVFDVDQSEGLYYIVMEYLDGQTVREMLTASGLLPLEQVNTIATQTAEALTYAHQREIVHRDIKPGNIMVMAGNYVKVMDFGIAKMKDANFATQAGSTIGTPEYMSPEQVSGTGIDWRSDIYSLGVVCFEMLTGQPPFQGADVMQTANMHLTAPVPSACAINPNLPVEVDATLQGALHKEKTGRYQTASEFAQALATACRVRNAHLSAGAEIETTIPMDATSQPPPAVETPPIPELPAGAAYLYVLTGQNEGLAYPLEYEEIHIGRDEANHITLEGDDRASRHHCLLRWEGNSWVIHDNNSTNGTFVNGQRVTQQTLQVGDIVTFGASQFQFVVT